MSLKYWFNPRVEGHFVSLPFCPFALLPWLIGVNGYFGIGVIKLDAKDINESEIVLPAKVKQELDWDTMDLLLKKNGNFREFMEIVKGDITLGRIANKNNYDSVIKDEDFERYVLDKKIISL